MKIKVFQIQDINSVLSKIVNANFSLKTAILIAENIDALSTPVSVIDKKRNDLINKYAKKDSSGQVITDENQQVSIENPEKFFPQWNELLNEEIEVDIKLIDLDELTKMADSDMKITPRDFLILKQFFITKEKAEESEDKTDKE